MIRFAKIWAILLVSFLFCSNTVIASTEITSASNTAIPASNSQSASALVELNNALLDISKQVQAARGKPNQEAFLGSAAIQAQIYNILKLLSLSGQTTVQSNISDKNQNATVGWTQNANEYTLTYNMPDSSDSFTMNFNLAAPTNFGALPTIALNGSSGQTVKIDLKDKFGRVVSFTTKLGSNWQNYAMPLTGASSPTGIKTFLVKPYIVYPADKNLYPEYEIAVSKYMIDLQNWYKEKVGIHFNMEPVKVVISPENYLTLRCGENPTQACRDNPDRIESNLPYYLNKAIHNNAETWEPQTVALIFSAGSGGWAAGSYNSQYELGWAVVGDWVLEPLSGKKNDWGIPCTESDGWQCSGGVPGGTPAHELGHAFGLPHPDIAGQSIMAWHGDYPNTGFLPYETNYLNSLNFFDVAPFDMTAITSIRISLLDGGPKRSGIIKIKFGQQGSSLLNADAAQKLNVELVSFESEKKHVRVEKINLDPKENIVSISNLAKEIVSERKNGIKDNLVFIPNENTLAYWFFFFDSSFSLEYNLPS